MEAFIAFVMPLVIMFGILYLFLIRPQKKKQKAHVELVAAL